MDDIDANFFVFFCAYSASLLRPTSNLGLAFDHHYSVIASDHTGSTVGLVCYAVFLVCDYIENAQLKIAK